MIDKFSLQDKEIIQSLRKLNNTEPRYPEDLLENRRSVFISDLTALTLATPSSGFLKSKFRILSHISSKNLDFFLISLILIASIFDVYLFRNEITEWVKSKISTPIVSNSVLTLQPNLRSTPIRTQTKNLTPTITVTVIYLKESEDKLNIIQNNYTDILSFKL